MLKRGYNAVENEPLKSFWITDICFIDFESLLVSVNGDVVAEIKGRKIYRMLQFFCYNCNCIVSKNQIISYVWDADENDSSTDVNFYTYISRIRGLHKIIEESLETITGIGYRLNCNTSKEAKLMLSNIKGRSGQIEESIKKINDDIVIRKNTEGMFTTGVGAFNDYLAVCDEIDLCQKKLDEIIDKISYLEDRHEQLLDKGNNDIIPLYHFDETLEAYRVLANKISDEIEKLVNNANKISYSYTKTNGYSYSGRIEPLLSRKDSEGHITGLKSRYFLNKCKKSCEFLDFSIYNLYDSLMEYEILVRLIDIYISLL